MPESFHSNSGLMDHVPLGHRQHSDPLGTCTCAHMLVFLWAAYGTMKPGLQFEKQAEKKKKAGFGLEFGTTVKEMGVVWSCPSFVPQDWECYRRQSLLGRCAHTGQSPEDIHAENTAGIRHA